MHFENIWLLNQRNSVILRGFSAHEDMKVELFVPCIIDQFFPEVAIHTFKVLKRADVEVEYNPEQTCCGRFAF